MSKEHPKFKIGDEVVLKKERGHRYFNNKNPEKPMIIDRNATRNGDTAKWWVMKNNIPHRYCENDLEYYCKCKLARCKK